MGPQDHLRAFLDGIGCTVCEERVPADRIRLLARRDDLLFLQIACLACGSTALGFVADAGGGPEPERVSNGSPITADEVLDMHGFLDTWTGDLASLVGRPDPTPEQRRARPTKRLRRAG